MDLDSGYFRTLYEGLHDHDADGRRRFLADHQRMAEAHLTELEPLRTREELPADGYTGDDEQLWRIMKLYGLSRVSDYLIELFCPAGEPPAGFGVTGGRTLVANDTHVEFLTGIGLTPFEHAGAFSPFHHEIFAVVQDQDATRVTVEDVLWPGFWFGDLLFSRAGVRIRAPRHLIDADAATTSTLYFTSRREPRPCNDLSHGWGSNSQWRTSFSRFYSDAEGLHYNWDGEEDLGDDPSGERRELLLHRCFVRADLPADEHDRFPYDDRLTEPPVR